MGTNFNQLQRYMSRGTCVALFTVLAIFLLAAATNASAQTKFVLSQNTAYAALGGGGAFSGEDPAGGSMAVNSMGVVIVGDTYGGGIIEYAPPTYAAVDISPDSKSNIGAVAIDSNGFLYAADQYGGNIIKVPMNANGTYDGQITVNTEDSGVATLPACAGDTKTPDTAGECVIGTITASIGGFGVSSMAFNSANALFVATDDQGDTGGVGPAYSIYECKSTCLYGATPTAPILIFAEPVTPAGSVATQGQYYIGGLAVDAFGNLFFTDSAEENGSLKSAASNVWELPVVTKAINPTLFASSPLQVVGMTNSSPGNYDNAIDAVATDGSGHLYVSVLYSGLYGLVDNGSLNGSSNGTQTASASSLYGIANQDQIKLLASDGHGNFYAIGNGSGGDTLYFISTGPVKFAGPETVGTPETASAVVADNTSACTPTLSITAASQFTATWGSCGNMFDVTGSFNAVTLSYDPTATGFDASSIVINDATSGMSSAPMIASASGAAITISQGTYGAALTSGGAWGGSSPDGHTGAINSKGVVVFGTSYGNQIMMVTNVAGVTTLFDGTSGNGVAGSYNGAGGVAIDGSDNLYISSEYGTTVYKFAPNPDGSYGPWTVDGNTNPLNPQGATPVACVGGSADVTAGTCSINIGAGNLGFGIAGMVIDATGNLFFTTDNQAEATGFAGTYAPNSVFECPLSCLYGATPTAPVMLFAEPTAAAGAAQMVPGSISIDSKDDVFFTDTSLSILGSEYSLFSDLNELAVNTGNSDGYANAPTVLVTLTPACTSLGGCNYNDAITTVSVDANGDAFFGTPYDGLFELANSSNTLSTIPWAVGGQQVKTIVPDGKGNFYYINYNSGDTTGYLTLGSVVVTPMAQPGTPSTVTNVTAIDNYASCYDSQDNLTFTAVDTDFSAVETANKNCGTLPFGAGTSFPVSVTFSPSASASGNVSTTLTATNSNSGDTGTATVSGQAAMAQPVVLTGITSPVVFGAEASYTLGVTGNTSGNAPTFAIDTTQGTQGIASITGTTLTITGVGTFDIDVTVAGGTVSGVSYAPFSGVVPITVNPAAQTLTYSGPTMMTYVATTVNLAASTTSSNTTSDAQPITFALVSGPGTVTSAGVLTITPAVSLTAPIVVTADQAASTDGDYAAATEITISIQVTPATQTVTITNPAGTSASSPDAINVGATVVLAATSSSGGAVTFSIDASSTAGAGSIGSDGVTLTALTPGSIVIDANQTGSDDYGAATQVQAFITVNPLGTVATPAISPASGDVLSTGTGGSDTVTITDSTTGAVIWYTTDGTNPLTSETATQYTAPFTLTTAGSATVNAAATLAGYTSSAVATSTYTVTATPPAFTASSSGGGSSSSPIVITGSTPGTTTLTVTPAGGFDQQISFSCAASTGITVSCSFSPTTITPTGNDTAIPVTVTISKGSGSAALQHGSNPFLPGGVSFAVLVLGVLGLKKRRSLLLAVVLIAGAIGVMQLTACGGTSSKTGTVAISSTGGGTTITTTVNVVVK
jgi:hypothetical protein